MLVRPRTRGEVLPEVLPGQLTVVRPDPYLSRLAKPTLLPLDGAGPVSTGSDVESCPGGSWDGGGPQDLRKCSGRSLCVQRRRGGGPAWDPYHVVVGCESTRHGWGDDPAHVQVAGLVRADAAGASHWLAEQCRDRNLAFSVGFFCDGRVRDALLLCQEEHWAPAVEPGARRRAGAYVIELTQFIDLSAWPPAPADLPPRAAPPRRTALVVR